jgi:hypothetical protein
MTNETLLTKHTSHFGIENRRRIYCFQPPTFGTFKKLVPIYQSTQCHILEGNILNIHFCQKPKCHIYLFAYIYLTVLSVAQTITY